MLINAIIVYPTHTIAHTHAHIYKHVLSFRTLMSFFTTKDQNAHFSKL